MLTAVSEQDVKQDKYQNIWIFGWSPSYQQTIQVHSALHVAMYEHTSALSLTSLRRNIDHFIQSIWFLSSMIYKLLTNERTREEKLWRNLRWWWCRNHLCLMWWRMFYNLWKRMTEVRGRETWALLAGSQNSNSVSETRKSET